MTYEWPRGRAFFRFDHPARRQHFLAPGELVELQGLHVHGYGLYIREDAQEVEDLLSSRLWQRTLIRVGTARNIGNDIPV